MANTESAGTAFQQLLGGGGWLTASVEQWVPLANLLRESLPYMTPESAFTRFAPGNLREGEQQGNPERGLAADKLTIDFNRLGEPSPNVFNF